MDRSAQLEELDSLKSIYYSEEFQVTETSNANDNIQAIFWAFFKLPDNYLVKYLKSLDSSEPSYLEVKHLPPIELQLTLPEDYPSKSPPQFVISCQWLDKSKITLLCKKLDEIWSDYGCVEIIYAWCDFLKNDSLSFLGCENELDLTDMCSKHLSFIQKLQRNEELKKMWEERNTSRLKECEPQESRVLMKNSTNSNLTENSDSVDSKMEPSPESSVNLKVVNSKTLEDDHYRHRQRYPYFRRHTNKNTNCRESDYGSYDERAVLNISLKMSPIKVIQNYNTEREKVEFSRNFYTCNICFGDKLGKDCTQFKDCNHVFCLNCIRSYFTVKIEDGSVQSIKCPEQKCTTEALPSQVKDIVSEELFARYDSFLLNVALDTLNTIYCPRQICQYPVLRDGDEAMAFCPNCQYVFCVTCRMVYHGIEPCQYKAGEIQKLFERYETGSDEVRKQMETRYGKKRLETLVNCIKAETWIKENSKPCPRCRVAIEKSQGCNKMVCWNCNAYFCWLCCSLLDVKNPYSHFSDLNSPCANKLFHLVYNFDDDEEADWDWINNSEEELSDSD